MTKGALKFYTDSFWNDTDWSRGKCAAKMLCYLSVGVPVIALDIIGAKPVAEFDCGVLINDLRPESIKQAIDEIESSFEHYSNNCLKAAEHYSLDKTAKPFVDYLAAK